MKLSEPPQMQKLDLASASGAIRKVHEICAKWEGQAVETSIARPKRLHWLKVAYGLVAMPVLLGYLLILSQVQWKTNGWVTFHLCGVWIIFGLWLAYTGAAIVVEAIYGMKEVREFASAFSRFDRQKVEADLEHSVELAHFDPSLLQLVASWLETRAKRIENQVNWLKGSAAMATAVLAASFLERSPLREQLTDVFTLPGIITAQLAVFSALMGVLLGLVSAGRCAANSSNRALHLRRILTERNTLLVIANLDAHRSERNDSEEKF
ncbi:MAG: hypothetical protein AAB214_07905 [Fibrobacterota bacterium]